MDNTPNIANTEKRAEKFLPKNDIAFGGRGEKNMPKLRCPSCGARLLDAADVGVRRRTRLFLYRGGESVQYVIKCNACRSCVGMSSSPE